MERLIEKLKEPTCIIKEGKIKYLNKLFAKTFGYEQDELKGQSIDILVPEYYRNKHTAQVADFIDNNKVGFVNPSCKKAQHKSGDVFSIDLNLSVLEDKEVLIVVRDRKYLDELYDKINNKIATLTQIIKEDIKDPYETNSLILVTRTQKPT